MALYRVVFFNQADQVSSLHHIDHQQDDAAIVGALLLNTEAAQAGAARFELWKDDRVVFQCRSQTLR